MNPDSEKKNGFATSKVIVNVIVFILFMAFLATLAIVGTRLFRQASADVAGQQNCLDALNIIVSDLRQAAPCSDPGRQGKPPVGYISINPSVGATAVLFPNKNSPIGNYLEFTEPNFGVFNPSEASFDRTNPANYKKIRYYISSNNTLKREVLTFNSNGDVESRRITEEVIIPNGKMSLSVNFISNTVVGVKITTIADGKEYSATTKVFISVK